MPTKQVAEKVIRPSLPVPVTLWRRFFGTLPQDVTPQQRIIELIEREVRKADARTARLMAAANGNAPTGDEGAE